MKIKEVQINKLSDQIKNFVKNNESLKTKIQDTEKKDIQLVEKLQTSKCFGLVYFKAITAK